MSEPVTNAEIEDVLSSIRRLVSEDVRNTVREHVEVARGEPDRLVLSPALRVADPDMISVSQDTHSEIENIASGTGAAMPSDVWETGAVQDAMLPTNTDEGTDQDVSTPWKDPGATLYDAAAAIEGESRLHQSYGEVSQEHSASSDAASSCEISEDMSVEPAHDAGELVEDETSEVVTAQEVDCQGQQSCDPKVDDPRTEADDAEDTSILVATEDQELSPQPIATERDGTEGETEDHRLRLSDAVEALSAAMSDSDGVEWEPHGDEPSNASMPNAEPLDWQETDEPDVSHAAPSFAYVDEDADDEEFQDALFDDDDETFLDEAMLRELVTDIVREELQGALGERITRNVRKLVRREINRALSVQDLE